MIPKLINFPPDLWQAARQKADITPLSAIIRKLVQAWLDGKIDLTKL